MLTDIVKQVGGEHVKMKSLVDQMASDTDLRLRRRRASLGQNRDVVFISGLGLAGGDVPLDIRIWL